MTDTGSVNNDKSSRPTGDDDDHRLITLTKEEQSNAESSETAHSPSSSATDSEPQSITTIRPAPRLTRVRRGVRPPRTGVYRSFKVIVSKAPPPRLVERLSDPIIPSAPLTQPEADIPLVPGIDPSDDEFVPRPGELPASQASNTGNTVASDVEVLTTNTEVDVKAGDTPAAMESEPVRDSVLTGDASTDLTPSLAPSEPAMAPPAWRPVRSNRPSASVVSPVAPIVRPASPFDTPTPESEQQPSGDSPVAGSATATPTPSVSSDVVPISPALSAAEVAASMLEVTAPAVQNLDEVFDGRPFVVSDADDAFSTGTGAYRDATGRGLSTIIDDDIVAVPAIPIATPRRIAKLPPTSTARVVVTSQKLRRTLIPILLTLGITLPTIGGFYFVLPEESALKAIDVTLPISLLCAGPIFLFFAVINMLQVRAALRTE